MLRITMLDESSLPPLLPPFLFSLPRRSSLPQGRHLRIAGYHLSALTLAIVVVLGVAASSPVFGQAKPQGSPVEKVLIKLKNNWNDASVQHDVVVLGRILADDYIFTDPDGVMFTRAQK